MCRCSSRGGVIIVSSLVVGRSFYVLVVVVVLLLSGLERRRNALSIHCTLAVSPECGGLFYEPLWCTLYIKSAIVALSSAGIELKCRRTAAPKSCFEVVETLVEDPAPALFVCCMALLRRLAMAVGLRWPMPGFVRRAWCAGWEKGELLGRRWAKRYAWRVSRDSLDHESCGLSVSVY